MKRIIERTDDGSATLFVPELNEHYHSTKGARTESQHIFIDMGLKASPALAPQVVEIGFGTGLNAWLTLEEAERSQRNVHYTGLELYPLAWETVKQLGYIDADCASGNAAGHATPAARSGLFEQLHTCVWETEVRLTPTFMLTKVQADVNRMIEEGAAWTADVIYFDAFAPEKQPEMWSQPLFDGLYARLNDGGILTTYCAKGVVRRMLQAAGFVVERLPGPPGGKREILRARKNN